MKTLYFLRHGKSSWEHDVIDHERPLKSRGYNDITLVSNYLKSKIESPQKMYVSDATRTLLTAKVFQEIFEIDESNFIASHRLYDFEGLDVMHFIKNIPNNFDIVMIVGHNHALTALANTLGNKFIDNIATAGFVQLQFDENAWENIKNGTTILKLFPSEIKS